MICRVTLLFHLGRSPSANPLHPLPPAFSLQCRNRSPHKAHHQGDWHKATTIRTLLGSILRQQIGAVIHGPALFPWMSPEGRARLR